MSRAKRETFFFFLDTEIKIRVKISLGYLYNTFYTPAVYSSLDKTYMGGKTKFSVWSTYTIYKFAAKGLQLHYLDNYSFYPVSLFMLFIGCFSGSPSVLETL